MRFTPAPALLLSLPALLAGCGSSDNAVLSDGGSALPPLSNHDLANRCFTLNARDVTDLGRYAIDKIMKKGFVFDIDHAEIRSKQYMLDVAGALSPNCPMISGHGGHGGINNAQAAQIIRQGGIIYPALPNGKDFTAFLQKLKPVWQASGTSRPIALGYGADANGLRNLPGPRGAGTTPIRYPFTLFQGPGWGPQFEAAGISPTRDGCACCAVQRRDCGCSPCCCWCCASPPAWWETEIRSATSA